VDFIDHLGHAVYPSHSFLGNLLFMEAEEPAAEEENTVFALARNPSHESSTPDTAPTHPLIQHIQNPCH
jgi:hypothetical protein